MKKIAIVFGGKSSESEVSKKTAENFAKALQELGYLFKMIDFSNNPIQEIIEYSPDIVLNGMHGAFGEDGRLAGALDILKIPYTHSNFFSSNIAMNKIMTKRLMRENNIPCLADIVVTKEELLNNKWKEKIKNDLILSKNTEFFVKEANEGSTIGCFLVTLDKIFEEKDFLPSHKIFLIEPRVFGREMTIPILENKAIGILEILPKKNTFYDYKSKYENQGSEHPILIINEDLKLKIMQKAEELHNIVGLSNLSRVDGFVINDKDFIFLEINTNPGMTNTSLLPEMAANIGISYNKLIQIILDYASYSLV